MAVSSLPRTVAMLLLSLSLALAAAADPRPAAPSAEKLDRARLVVSQDGKKQDLSSVLYSDCWRDVYRDVLHRKLEEENASSSTFWWWRELRVALNDDADKEESTGRKSLASLCSHLDWKERVRIAIRMTNCHVSMAGMDTFECDETMSVESCLEPMAQNIVAFNAYTSFHQETLNICMAVAEDDRAAKQNINLARVFTVIDGVAAGMEDAAEREKELLEHQERLQTTLHGVDSVVHDVAESTSSVALTLKASAATQKEILSKQADANQQIRRIHEVQTEVAEDVEMTLSKQRELLSMQAQANEAEAARFALTEDQLSTMAKQTDGLYEALTASVAMERELTAMQERTAGMIKSLQDNQENASVALIERLSSFAHEVDDRVEQIYTLQQALYSSFLDVRTFVFYFVSTILAWVLTSTPRTASARYPLYIGLGLECYLERAIVARAVSAEFLDRLSLASMEEAIEAARYAFVVYALLALLIAVVLHRNYAKLSFQAVTRVGVDVTRVGDRIGEVEDRLEDVVNIIQAGNEEVLQAVHALLANHNVPASVSKKAKAIAATPAASPPRKRTAAKSPGRGRKAPATVSRRSSRRVAASSDEDSNE